jgi:hypothetical protein
MSSHMRRRIHVKYIMLQSTSDSRSASATVPGGDVTGSRSASATVCRAFTFKGQAPWSRGAPFTSFPQGSA